MTVTEPLCSAHATLRYYTGGALAAEFIGVRRLEVRGGVTAAALSGEGLAAQFAVQFAVLQSAPSSSRSPGLGVIDNLIPKKETRPRRVWSFNGSGCTGTAAPLLCACVLACAVRERHGGTLLRAVGCGAV